jgi:hypothetical protein
MEREMAQMIEQLQKMQAEEQKKSASDSRIIVPGR